jgi:hypothetical protein
MITKLKAVTISASTLAAAIALGVLFAPAAARAGEYCSEDYSFTRNCSFSSMEQCEAAISGMNAACLRDPFLKEDSNEAINRPFARTSEEVQPPKPRAATPRIDR